MEMITKVSILEHRSTNVGLSRFMTEIQPSVAHE